MSDIKSFAFTQNGAETIREYKYGTDWPVVYILENGKDLYVGETVRPYARTRAHLDGKDQYHLKNIHIISDDEFNKSATLDTESSLIEYMVADAKFHILNGNSGLQNHHYFDREKYQSKFETLWQKLQSMQLAKKDLLQIRNSDLFKYSPYKTLTDEQYIIATRLTAELSSELDTRYLIHGGPGTGKTILAIYLLRQLVQEHNHNVGLVIAMTSLRKTLKKVFKGIPGLKPNMVIAPGDVVKQKYDVLIVDEAHRLRKRKNITNFRQFDTTNKALGLGNDGDELDWVLKSSKKTVLFYDKNQSVKPSDVSHEKFVNGKFTQLRLNKQLRVKGGEEYLHFIDGLFEHQKEKQGFKDYDFKLFDDLEKMVTEIKNKDREHELCRMVSGYAWDWVSRNNPSEPDIVIGSTKLFWNSQTHDWVNSQNAVNEVGCIHTIQGYDLSYTGVIIGPEISYDPEKKEIVINRKKYKDTNGHRGITDPEELKRYIINIYKTLLTRGILGTYVYVVDENLGKYLQSRIK